MIVLSIYLIYLKRFMSNMHDYWMRLWDPNIEMLKDKFKFLQSYEFDFLGHIIDIFVKLSWYKHIDVPDYTQYNFSTDDESNYKQISIELKTGTIELNADECYIEQNNKDFYAEGTHQSRRTYFLIVDFKNEIVYY